MAEPSGHIAQEEALAILQNAASLGRKPAFVMVIISWMDIHQVSFLRDPSFSFPYFFTKEKKQNQPILFGHFVTCKMYALHQQEPEREICQTVKSDYLQLMSF